MSQHSISSMRSSRSNVSHCASSSDISSMGVMSESAKNLKKENKTLCAASRKQEKHGAVREVKSGEGGGGVTSRSGGQVVNARRGEIVGNSRGGEQRANLGAGGYTRVGHGHSATNVICPVVLQFSNSSVQYSPPTNEEGVRVGVVLENGVGKMDGMVVGTDMGRVEGGYRVLNDRLCAAELTPPLTMNSDRGEKNDVNNMTIGMSHGSGVDDSGVGGLAVVSGGVWLGGLGDDRAVPGAVKFSPMPVDTSGLADEELMFKVLNALKGIKLKFPGLDNENTAQKLHKIGINWSEHKSMVTVYWKQTLDSSKRYKVIGIVRSYVDSILQQVYCILDISELRAHRLFSRIFSRMLWNHGQGLLECLDINTACSWLVIYNKNTDSLTRTEYACAEVVVQLCTRCTLIVYQCSAERTHR